MKLSCVITNWNYGMFLADALECILAQTRTPDEVVYIDDCSSDDSAEVFERYRKQLINKTDLWQMPDDYETYMKTGNCISGSSMCRKKAWESVGGFRDTQMEDYDLWQRIISADWKAKHLPETMIFWRRHDFGTRTERNDHAKR